MLLRKDDLAQLSTGWAWRKMELVVETVTIICSKISLAGDWSLGHSCSCCKSQLRLKSLLLVLNF